MHASLCRQSVPWEALVVQAPPFLMHAVVAKTLDPRPMLPSTTFPFPEAAPLPLVKQPAPCKSTPSP